MAININAAVSALTIDNRMIIGRVGERESDSRGKLNYVWLALVCSPSLKTPSSFNSN